MMAENLFDAAAAREAQAAGIAQVSSWPAEDWVRLAREEAIRIAARRGQVCSDDLYETCPPPKDLHPNAVGAVFSTKRLHLIGYKKSKRPSGHARRIGIYEVAG